MTKLIDVHSHPLLPIWKSALAKATGESAKSPSIFGTKMPPWSTELHLDVMDKNEISVGMLSLPGATNFLTGADARALARAVNEELANIVSGHSARFGAFAVVPLDNMEAAIEETAYALDVLKLDGVSSSTHYLGRHLGDCYFDPWFDEMNRRGTTLFAHPVPPSSFRPGGGGLDVSILEFMFESTRMVANLVLSGTKKKYSDIKIISTHGGGTIPYLASRISILEPVFGAGDGNPILSSEEVIAGLGSFYFDLTASTAAASLDAIRYLVPADQMLMGFDYPMMPASTIAPARSRFAAYGDLRPDERDMILSQNATRLFPRLAKL
jgi:predicted TIM-barrel fold metal-dependent hydrolase